ncbi:MAG: hypothetical protein IH598_16265 [Bacteroidales bacterium]|nr:hypothetical protein [Bacteroidales bacterium]
MIELKNVPDAFTDKKDNFLFALYKTGKATALVPGDKLLIKEAAHKKMKVLNWQEFKQLIDG